MIYFTTNLSILSILKLIIILIFIIFHFILISLEIKIFNKTSMNQTELKSGMIDSKLMRRLNNSLVVISSLASMYGGYVAYKQEKGFNEKLEEKHKQYESEINTLQKSILDDKFTNSNMKLNFHNLNNILVKTTNESLLQMKNLENIKDEIKQKNREMSILIDPINKKQLKDQIEILSSKENELVQLLYNNLKNTQTELASVQSSAVLDESFQATDSLNTLSTSTDLTKIDKSSISSIIESIFEYYFSLNAIEKIAFSLLMASYALGSLLISIVFIFYGDFLIKKFNLEERYPRLAKIIQMRRKFQHYYLLLNFFWIFLILFGEISLSIAILFF